MNSDEPGLQRDDVFDLKSSEWIIKTRSFLTLAQANQDYIDFTDELFSIYLKARKGIQHPKIVLDIQDSLSSFIYQTQQSKFAAEDDYTRFLYMYSYRLCQILVDMMVWHIVGYDRSVISVLNTAPRTPVQTDIRGNLKICKQLYTKGDARFFIVSDLTSCISTCDILAISPRTGDFELFESKKNGKRFTSTGPTMPPKGATNPQFAKMLGIAEILKTKKYPVVNQIGQLITTDISRKFLFKKLGRVVKNAIKHGTAMKKMTSYCYVEVMCFSAIKGKQPPIKREIQKELSDANYLSSYDCFLQKHNFNHSAKRPPFLSWPLSAAICFGIQTGDILIKYYFSKKKFVQAMASYGWIIEWNIKPFTTNDELAFIQNTDRKFGQSNSKDHAFVVKRHGQLKSLVISTMTAAPYLYEFLAPESINAELQYIWDSIDGYHILNYRKEQAIFLN